MLRLNVSSGRVGRTKQTCGWVRRPGGQAKRRAAATGWMAAFTLFAIGPPGIAAATEPAAPAVLLIADRHLGEALTQTVRSFGSETSRVEISVSPIDAACAAEAGVAPRLALLAASPSRAELEACSRTADAAVSTVPIGRQAVALVAPLNSPVWSLDAVALFRALGQNSGAVPMPATWSQVDASYPALPIGLLVPPPGSEARRLFDTLILEPGCTDAAGADAPFDVESRIGYCGALRSDIPLARRFGVQDMADWAATATPGQIAIVTVGELRDLDRRVVALLLDGALPTAEKLQSGDYHAAETVELLLVVPYAAEADIRTAAKAIAFDLLAEANIGPVGTLAPGGLVALPPSDRIAARSHAMAFMEQY